jgi:hypothetical protein
VLIEDLSDCLLLLGAVDAGDLAIESFHIPGVVKDADAEDDDGDVAVDALVNAARGDAAGDDAVDGRTGRKVCWGAVDAGWGADNGSKGGAGDEAWEGNGPITVETKDEGGVVTEDTFQADGAFDPDGGDVVLKASAALLVGGAPLSGGRATDAVVDVPIVVVVSRPVDDAADDWRRKAVAGALAEEDGGICPVVVVVDRALNAGTVFEAVDVDPNGACVVDEARGVEGVGAAGKIVSLPSSGLPSAVGSSRVAGAGVAGAFVDAVGDGARAVVVDVVVGAVGGDGTFVEMSRNVAPRKTCWVWTGSCGTPKTALITKLLISVHTPHKELRFCLEEMAWECLPTRL